MCTDGQPCPGAENAADSRIIEVKAEVAVHKSITPDDPAERDALRERITAFLALPLAAITRQFGQNDEPTAPDTRKVAAHLFPGAELNDHHLNAAKSALTGRMEMELQRLTASAGSSPLKAILDGLAEALGGKAQDQEEDDSDDPIQAPQGHRWQRVERRHYILVGPREPADSGAEVVRAQLRGMFGSTEWWAAAIFGADGSGEPHAIARVGSVELAMRLVEERLALRTEQPQPQPPVEQYSNPAAEELQGALQSLVDAIQARQDATTAAAAVDAWARVMKAHAGAVAILALHGHQLASDQPETPAAAFARGWRDGARAKAAEDGGWPELPGLPPTTLVEASRQERVTAPAPSEA